MHGWKWASERGFVVCKWRRGWNVCHIWHKSCCSKHITTHKTTFINFCSLSLPLNCCCCCFSSMPLLLLLLLLCVQCDSKIRLTIYEWMHKMCLQLQTRRRKKEEALRWGEKCCCALLCICRLWFERKFLRLWQNWNGGKKSSNVVGCDVELS